MATTEWKSVLVEATAPCIGRCGREILAGQLGFENPRRFAGYLCPKCVDSLRLRRLGPLDRQPAFAESSGR